MPQSHSPVVFHDVLDPLTGNRSDVRIEVPGPGGGVELDGSALWVLPALYDADAHLPVLLHGLRETDRWRALAGGVAELNSATPWHLVRDLPLSEVTSFFDQTALPRIRPILSISDQPSSEGFADWFADHAAEIRETWMPTVKCYSNDPFFRRNLEAIWAGGCRAAIYFYDDESFESVVSEHAGPVHFRHVISTEMAAKVAARPDSTSQCSPHFLLALPDGRSDELFVLPKVPGGQARDSLRADVSGSVSLLASDHNAPIADSKGPGLDAEQHLLPALLGLADEKVLDLRTALAMATERAAEVFRPAGGIGGGIVVVDPAPQPVGLWPGQEARRAAFRGLELPGTVRAVAVDGRGTLL